MEYVIGAIIIIVLIIGFSKLKKTNNDLNDSYPFEPDGKLK